MPNFCLMTLRPLLTLVVGAILPKTLFGIDGGLCR